MLCEVVSHGKVCDEQGMRFFGDVLKFRSEQKLTDEERLGWLSKDISFMGVLHVCRRGNLEKRQKVEIERRRPRLIVGSSLGHSFL